MSKKQKEKLMNKLDKELYYNWDMVKKHHEDDYEKSEQYEIGICTGLVIAKGMIDKKWLKK